MGKIKYNLKEIWKCLDEPSDEMDKLNCLIEKLEGYEKELRSPLLRGLYYKGEFYVKVKEILG